MGEDESDWDAALRGAGLGGSPRIVASASTLIEIKTDTVSADDFASWLSPKRSLALLGGPENFAAMPALVNRLKLGRIIACAETTVLSDDDGQAEPLHYQIVPARVWAMRPFQHPGALWTIGDETFDMGDRYHDSGDNWVALTGIRFAPDGIEALKLAFEGETNEAAPQAEGASSIEKTHSPRGRKAASWWPGFAEELAVYFHEEGFPEGSGADGQGDIIKAVLQRLSDKGIEASRTTIQPVVQAVLDRLRAAGK